MNQAKSKTKALLSLSDWQVVGLALIVGTIVRFLNMAKGSIWHDEGYTMMLAPQSPTQIIARTARDVHPPLYYITLHYWMKIFGSSEVGARSLSAALMLGTIVIGFLLAKRLFGRTAAQLSAIFLALGPFLVRYSQEARMYGMAAFLALLATYLLVRAQESNDFGWWAGYAVTIAAALYTHYYAVFVIALHWLYMILVKKPTRGIKNPRWWGANVAAGILFLPWLPSAYHQFTRVQAAFWIPKPTALTLPSTIGQFLTFTDVGAVAASIRILVMLAFIALTVWFVLKDHDLPNRFLIAGLTFLAPVIVLVLSLKRPIYVDRYFVFAAAGFYILLAAIIGLMPPWKNRPWLQFVSLATTSLVLIIGIGNVYHQATHNMKAVGNYVNQRFQPGDEIISGELYTYFDFSYYNHTGATAKLLAPYGVDGYGESSLLYDRADQIIVHKFAEAKPTTGKVWIIGKPGANDDFKVPSPWKLLDQYQAADSKVVHYQVSQ